MNAAKRSRLTVLVFAASAAFALAQGGYESATPFKASQILPPALVKGPHFQVKEDVPTTGYFHDFDITSDYGDISAEGRSLLRMRVHEIEALARLDEVSKTEVFMKAAGNSVLNVGKGVASVVANPGATAKGVGAGVKRFGTNLGRKAKRGAEDASDAVSGDDQKASGEPEKSSGDKAADAGTGAAKGVLGTGAGPRSCASIPTPRTQYSTRRSTTSRRSTPRAASPPRSWCRSRWSWARRPTWEAWSGARTPRSCAS
jgi:hypothetical protein